MWYRLWGQARDSIAFPTTDASQPDLRLEEYIHDLGSTDAGGTAACSIRCKNVGGKELIIKKVETPCGCTAAVAGDTLVPPGGSSQIKVTFDSKGYSGWQEQMVYIHCNDPIAPTEQLRVISLVRPESIVFAPRKLNFGRLKRHELATLEVHVADPGDGSLQVTSVTSNTYMAKAKVTPSTDKRYPGYIVTAELRPDVPPGELLGKLTLYTNHPQQPQVEIPFAATIRGDIEFSPEAFFFGVLRKGTKAEKRITITTTGEAPLKISKVDIPFDYIATRVKPRSDGKA